MKYGLNLLLWTDRMHDGLVPVVEKIKALGYDGIEMPIFELNEPLHAQWGRRLDDLGLARTAVTVRGAGDVRLPVPGVERIVRGRGALPGRPRVAHRGQIVRQRIERFVDFEIAAENLLHIRVRGTPYLVSKKTEVWFEGNLATDVGSLIDGS